MLTEYYLSNILEENTKYINLSVFFYSNTQVKIFTKNKESIPYHNDKKREKSLYFSLSLVAEAGLEPTTFGL